MARRPGFGVTVRHDADGGQSPNFYMPLITAEVRLFWPPKATREQILDALEQAVEEAMDKFDQQYEPGVGLPISRGTDDGT